MRQLVTMATLPTPRDASSAKAPSVPNHVVPMSGGEHCLHRVLMDAMLASGVVPPVRAPADPLGTTEAEICARLAALASADFLALDAKGVVFCLYPFATTTPHVVVVDGQRRFAMCAIDPLGIPAMLGQELDVEGRCAVCDAPFALRVGPGVIVAALPPTSMVVARRHEAEPAFVACCPFTVFVCGQEHAERFMRRVVGTGALALPHALADAEWIFGDLLAGILPTTRRRGSAWDRSRDA